VPPSRRNLAVVAPVACALVLLLPAAARAQRFAPAPPPPARVLFRLPERAESPAPPIAWRDPNAALVEARREHKIVLIVVDVTWSAWCTRMQRTTFQDPGVREDVARSFVPARLDAEEDGRRVFYDGRPLTHRAFADRFRVATYPTTVFLTPDGAPITRVPGFVGPARFRTLLRYVAEGHYRRTTWEEFAGPPPDTDEDQP